MYCLRLWSTNECNIVGVYAASFARYLFGPNSLEQWQISTLYHSLNKQFSENIDPGGLVRSEMHMFFIYLNQLRFLNFFQHYLLLNHPCSSDQTIDCSFYVLIYGSWILNSPEVLNSIRFDKELTFIPTFASLWHMF